MINTGTSLPDVRVVNGTSNLRSRCDKNSVRNSDRIAAFQAVDTGSIPVTGFENKIIYTLIYRHTIGKM